MSKLQCMLCTAGQDKVGLDTPTHPHPLPLSLVMPETGQGAPVCVPVHCQIHCWEGRKGQKWRIFLFWVELQQFSTALSKTSLHTTPSHCLTCHLVCVSPSTIGADLATSDLSANTWTPVIVGRATTEPSARARWPMASPSTPACASEDSEVRGANKHFFHNFQNAENIRER